MDGSIRNSKFGGKRISLASKLVAASVYPSYVKAICLGTLHIHSSLTTDGVWLVHLESNDNPHIVVLKVDFDRMVEIAREFGDNPRAFLSEPESDILRRISARLSVKFSDRSDF